jgi:hypothetical protein
MIKFLLLAILIAVCWPIAAVALGVWMFVALVKVCTGGAVFLGKALKR